jgi:hypothetical protein
LNVSEPTVAKYHSAVRSNCQAVAGSRYGLPALALSWPFPSTLVVR